MAPIAIPFSPSPTPEAFDLKAQVLQLDHRDGPTSSLFHHSTPRPTAVSAQGLEFTLSDGRVILDGISGGAAVACLGQGNQEVLGAMMEQASKMAYTYHQSVGCESGEKLAEMLCAKGGFEAAAFLNSGKFDMAISQISLSRCLPLDSGSEAIESCIKLVRQYWVEKGENQRKYIIARFPSYHGNTLGALAVSSLLLRTHDVLR